MSTRSNEEQAKKVLEIIRLLNNGEMPDLSGDKEEAAAYIADVKRRMAVNGQSSITKMKFNYKNNR